MTGDGSEEPRAHSAGNDSSVVGNGDCGIEDVELGQVVGCIDNGGTLVAAPAHDRGSASRVMGLAPTVGSSSRRIEGRWIMAVAACKRRCCPPERLPAVVDSGERHRCGEFRDPLAGFVATHAVHAGKDEEVLASRRGGVERELLRRKTEMAAHSYAVAGRVVTRDPYVSPVELRQAHDGASNILRSLWPTRPTISPAATVEIETVEHDRVTESFLKSDRDEQIAHGPGGDFVVAGHRRVDDCVDRLQIWPDVDAGLPRLLQDETLKEREIDRA